MSCSHLGEDRRERRDRGAEVERHEHDADQREGSPGPERSGLGRLHLSESRLEGWPTSPVTSRSASARGIDERGVTSDRREPTATVLRSIAGALRRAGEAGWTAQDRRRGPHRGRRRRRTRRGLRPPARAAGPRQRPACARHERPRPRAVDAPVEGTADAAAALEARAVTITDRPQPTRLVELDDAVVAAVRIGDALGRRSRCRRSRRAPWRCAAPPPHRRRSGRSSAATACTRRMPRGRSATDRSSSAPPTSSSGSSPASAAARRGRPATGSSGTRRLRASARARAQSESRSRARSTSPRIVSMRSGMFVNATMPRRRSTNSTSTTWS